MMNINEIKNKAFKIEDEIGREFEEICDFIFKNAELGDEEYVSSSHLVEKMKSYGFKVEMPYCDLKTAFRAELGDEEGPTIAFLAEYDALPGYGEGKNENAHACGHNWIAAGTLGSAIVLSKLKENFKGKIILMGTPAEETMARKCDLVKAGAFDNIDVVFQMHLESKNNVHCEALAIDAVEFSFKGKATHAAAHPHMGINALDAVQLTFAGVNALRQHVTDDVRIHGIISEGGQAPNIVPDFAQCKFYVRANERKYLNGLTEKVINCARGAELMTGAELSYRYFENSNDNIINVPILQEMMKKNLQEVGVNNFVDAQQGPKGSTDIGNVSQVCPTMYTELALDISPMSYVHEEEFLQHVNSKEAYDKLHKSIKAMVASALEVYLDDRLLEKIKEQHLNEKNKKL